MGGSFCEDELLKAGCAALSRPTGLWPSDDYGSAWKEQHEPQFPVPPENNSPDWAIVVWARIKESIVFSKSLVFCNLFNGFYRKKLLANAICWLEGVNIHKIIEKSLYPADFLTNSWKIVLTWRRRKGT
jgi:hypothetical protein